MSTEHRFTIEVTAVAHREPQDKKALKGWKQEVENSVASALLYREGRYSAIVRVIEGEAVA
jgi:hypothetical protein